MILVVYLRWGTVLQHNHVVVAVQSIADVYLLPSIYDTQYEVSFRPVVEVEPCVAPRWSTLECIDRCFRPSHDSDDGITAAM